jgi:hypothetical protein
MSVSYNAIKTCMSLVLSQDVPSLLGHLQATPFVEETMYCTLIGCYFHFYYFPFFLIFLSLFLVCGYFIFFFFSVLTFVSFVRLGFTVLIL